MNQGEIWLVDLNPTVGAEITKIRPAIIVNSNNIGKLPLKIIVPITDWKPNYGNIDWMTKINPDPKNKLSKISAADSFQVRSISVSRFVKRIGVVDELTLSSIKDSLAYVLDID